MSPLCLNLTSNFLFSLELNPTLYLMCWWPPMPHDEKLSVFSIHSALPGLVYIHLPPQQNFLGSFLALYMLFPLPEFKLTLMVPQYYGSFSLNVLYSGRPSRSTHLSATTCNIILCTAFIALSTIEIFNEI